MNEHLDKAIQSFEDFGKSPSHQALITGLRSFADAIELHEQQTFATRSAVDILTNDELAQTIADLKATIQAFK